MQICENCLRELFDFDLECDICGCKNIISNKLYLETKEELEMASVFKRKKLIENYPYNVVFKYITEKKGKSYWKEIKSKIKDYGVIYPSETETTPSITCPYCHSTNTKKISSVSRMISIGFWGLGSGKVGKQFHCNECNADF